MTITINGQSWSEQQVVGLLKSYYDLGQEIKQMEDARTRTAAIIKEHLVQNGGSLTDGENGLIARQQERQGAARWGLVNTPDAIVLWAAKRGLLTVDNKLLAALEDKFIQVLDLKKYRMPGKPTTALVVEKKE